MELVGQNTDETRNLEFLHDISRRIAAADPFHSILRHILDFIMDVVHCNSCFIYTLEGNRLMLRASKNPHLDLLDRISLKVGQGITGWVAEHDETVSIPCHASKDPRFQMFNQLPEDRYEAFLSVPIRCRGQVVGIINLQHRQPHHHTKHEIGLISTIGFLVGAELELARLEAEHAEMQRRLDTRALMERAKAILQRQLQINEQEAYFILQKGSRQKRRSVREIAEAIILSDELRMANK
ncbi:GAF and ANTAR domain-containing protein [Granulicella sp. dw_53]|uniref:GAF and ANTAR domain-containing protein n=1 Tax=Granulicella sp. dw_53 TaxID=2719792 RepID=UPI001BD65867|nr:GAF and ANTAR domain-containing protein [Granulicella sp. dw_53]